MLTLKVVTIDNDGQKETHLFCGERIQHKEISTNKRLKFSLGLNESVISTMSDTPESEQEYTYSTVCIFDGGDNPKTLLWIMPCADCYITEGGTTVDTFSARYK